jgi:enoyl-CoA hydratase/carnithine racemase
MTFMVAGTGTAARTVEVDIRDGVMSLVLDRPKVHNAFNEQMVLEIRAAWERARADDVHVVVITGAGDKAFCVGVDRAEAIGEKLGDTDQPPADPTTSFNYIDPGEDLGAKACGLYKPVIAAVNGMACGGALYFLGEADIIIAAEHATFFDPHVTYGMAASYESVHLGQKLPFGEVLRTQLMGAHERLSAARAYELGLVSEVVPAARLAQAARSLGSSIAAIPPDRAQAVVRTVWTARELGRTRALALLGRHP